MCDVLTTAWYSITRNLKPPVEVGVVLALRLAMVESSQLLMQILLSLSIEPSTTALEG